MRKNAILILSIFFTITVFSQRLEYGTGLQLTNIKGKSLVFPLNPQYNNDTTYLDSDSRLFAILFGGGIHLPIYNITDEMNLGIQANIIIGALGGKSHNGLNGPGLSFYIPAYLTYNFGAGSSIDSDLPIGFGFGIGYQYSLYAFSTTSSTNDNGIYSYHKPTLMLQITDLWSFDNLLIRFETQLGGKQYIEKEYKGLSYGYDFIHSTFSLIIYTNK